MDVYAANCCNVLPRRLHARRARRRPSTFPRSEVPCVRGPPRASTQDAQGHAQINQPS